MTYYIIAENLTESNAPQLAHTRGRAFESYRDAVKALPTFSTRAHIWRVELNGSAVLGYRELARPGRPKKSRIK